MGYEPRIVDAELEELLSGLPALALAGPKAVGKTATALRVARTVYRLDDVAEREIVEADPARLLTGENPILIDEWQRVPHSWDLVRRAVDDEPRAGRFLLTGSAPPLQQPTHSGAGRIPTLRMRPMSLAERLTDVPTVSLGELLRGSRPRIEGDTSVGLAAYVGEIVRSGFPGIRRLPERSVRQQLSGYIERVVERDFEEAGRRVRDEGTLRRWLSAYAAATSTTTTFEKIRDAATAGQATKPARTTTEPYRAVLESLWLIEEVPAWLPVGRPINQLARSPKHQLADPALAAQLLGIGPDALLDGRSAGPPIPREGSLLGALFESLVTLSVRTYAQAAEAHVLHLRTHRGQHEVDLIVERADRRVVAIEVKLGQRVGDDDVRHLGWLRDQLGDDLLDSVVVTTGRAAYRRPDGIAVVPAALLGP